MMRNKFVRNLAGAVVITMIGLVMYAGALLAVGNPDPAEAKPRPAPSKTVAAIPTVSPLAVYLQIQDCPTEDAMDMICVWDASWAGNGIGQSTVRVFGEVFLVGYNDDGTVWVDFNHDGDPGYPDA